MRRVALITGASRGIGREIAMAFAAQGYGVALNFLKEQARAEEAARAVAEAGGEPLLLQADVGDPRQAGSLARRALARWGRIDALVNNAAVTRDRSILKMSDEEWLEPLRVNLSGAFWCLRACARAMCKRRGGAIVNVGSIVGLRGGIGDANYAASKAGLIALTKAAARELGRFNLRVNAVLPGFHLTDLGRTVWDSQKEKILSEHALGRLTDARELARFVVFLSEQASASGQVYSFDSRVL